MYKMIAVLSGALFGAGLSISQMTNPQKVLAFLDITGNWDPSLAVVMAAAVVVSLLAYRIRPGMQKPLASNEFSVPEEQPVNPKMLAGNVMFGIGWGLIGLCPGPVIASLAAPSQALLIFMAAMFIAFVAVNRIQTRSESPQAD